MGELFYVRDLAIDCAQDHVYEFFFCAPLCPIGLGLQYVSQNGYFGLDIEHLCDLAYRLDGTGNLVSF